MSAMLNRLLDPARLAECRRHDPDYGRFAGHPLDPRTAELDPADEAHVDRLVLADQHSFAEWLLDACHGVDRVSNTDWICRVDTTFQHRLQGATVAQILHLFRTSTDAEVRAACWAQIEREWAESENAIALRESHEAELRRGAA